jgi:hypothetical protein
MSADARDPKRVPGGESATQCGSHREATRVAHHSARRCRSSMVSRREGAAHARRWITREAMWLGSGPGDDVVATEQVQTYLFPRRGGMSADARDPKRVPGGESSTQCGSRREATRVAQPSRRQSILESTRVVFPWRAETRRARASARERASSANTTRERARPRLGSASRGNPVQRGSEVQVLERGVPIARLVGLDAGHARGKRKSSRSSSASSGIIRRGTGDMLWVLEQKPLSLPRPIPSTASAERDSTDGDRQLVLARLRDRAFGPLERRISRAPSSTATGARSLSSCST